VGDLGLKDKAVEISLSLAEDEKPGDERRKAPFDF